MRCAVAFHTELHFIQNCTLIVQRRGAIFVATRLHDQQPIRNSGEAFSVAQRAIIVGRKLCLFVALLASALLLGPALAHAFELPNKIGLPREEYFIVQKAYRGWNLLAWLLAVQVLALLAAAISARPERRVMVFTLLALACVLAAQGVFWTFTYPANVAHGELDCLTG